LITKRGAPPRRLRTSSRRARLEQVITEEKRLQGEGEDEIVEGARTGPITAAQPNSILEEMGRAPCSRTSSRNAGGGVVVSYFEWVQGLQEYFLEGGPRVNAKLNDIITKAFDETWATMEQRGGREWRTALRTGLAVQRVGRSDRDARASIPESLHFRASGLKPSQTGLARLSPMASRRPVHRTGDAILCDRAPRDVLAAEKTSPTKRVDVTGVGRNWRRAYREYGCPCSRFDGERAFVYHVQPEGLRRKTHRTKLDFPVPFPRPRSPSGRPECPRLLQRIDTRSRFGRNRLTVGVAARLSRYLQVLTQAKKMGKDRISSQEIADYTNINATQIRRDLSGFGKFGKRGVGYNIDSLLGEIRKILRTQGPAQHRADRRPAASVRRFARQPDLRRSTESTSAGRPSTTPIPEKVGRRRRQRRGDAVRPARPRSSTTRNIIVGVPRGPRDERPGGGNPDPRRRPAVKIVFKLFRGAART